MQKKIKLKPRGVRMSDDAWEKCREIARDESVRTKSSITTSDVVRHACDLFLEERERDIEQGKSF